MLPRMSSRFATTSKSLLASAEKISAGASTFMLIRLTQPMSGFARRAYSQPSAMIENTGRMMPRTRSSIRGCSGPDSRRRQCP